MMVGRLALLASAAALKASAPADVTEAFVRTRLQAAQGALYGAAQLDEAMTGRLLERVLPEA
jgi:hypothetical protein